MKRANIINTINITKGFIQNNCNVSLFAPSNKKPILISFFFKNQSINVNFVDNLLNLNTYDIIYFREIVESIRIIKEKQYEGYMIVETHNVDIPIEEINILKSYNKIIFTSISPMITNKYNFTKSLLFPCSIDFKTFSDKSRYKNDLFSSKDFNILYCGHLYDYKGIPLVIEAAKILKEYKFHMVGGTKEDIYRHKQKSPKNMIFYGHKNYNEVPNYLYSADLLLIPYCKRGNKWSPSTITSPIKLFEYLSTKKPVLCSKIVGIKNWITEDEAYFYKADKLSDFIEKIKYIQQHKNTDECNNKIINGLKKASYYTTANKCKELLKLCK